MNKAELLQSVVTKSPDDDSDYPDGFIEWRGRGGWWLTFDVCRYFYDEGEYLGQNGIEALNTLKTIGFDVSMDTIKTMKKLTKKVKKCY